MTINDWLLDAQPKLKALGIESARLDCLIILELALGKNRTWILANPDYKISTRYSKTLKNLFNRRMDHEPIAYIKGVCEFYGREFVVSKDVLQPRPESEAIIELLLQITPSIDNPIIGDIGCGSGALGITAGLELPNSRVDLIDIDQKALEIAKINAKKFTTTINTIQSDLLSDTATKYNILLCNLPYVPDEYLINQAAKHEPSLALFGGPDGLDLYRKLFQQLKLRKNKVLFLLIECLPSQQAQLADIAAKSGYKLAKTKDYVQLYKISN